MLGREKQLRSVETPTDIEVWKEARLLWSCLSLVEPVTKFSTIYEQVYEVGASKRQIGIFHKKTDAKKRAKLLRYYPKNGQA